MSHQKVKWIPTCGGVFVAAVCLDFLFCLVLVLVFVKETLSSRSRVLEQGLLIKEKRQ